MCCYFSTDCRTPWRYREEFLQARMANRGVEMDLVSAAPGKTGGSLGEKRMTWIHTRLWRLPLVQAEAATNGAALPPGVWKVFGGRRNFRSQGGRRCISRRHFSAMF
eukprot:COSAG02_NODE_1127_length_14428_cov_68.304627_5_plen_107_part_00